jgi:hypothetical protein
MEEVLGFCAWLLTVLMMLGASVWLCCSIVESIIKTRRRLRRARYYPLLSQNKRLKSALADSMEENFRLKKIYHTDAVRRKEARLARKGA